MLQSEVIRKLSVECAVALGELDHLQTIRTYIQMALSIGIDHFYAHESEIVVLDMEGKEAGRFKNITSAAKAIGIPKTAICAVINGRRHSAGGLMFIKTEDYELVPREESTSSLPIVPLS